MDTVTTPNTLVATRNDEGLFVTPSCPRCHNRVLAVRFSLKIGRRWTQKTKLLCACPDRYTWSSGVSKDGDDFQPYFERKVPVEDPTPFVAPLDLVGSPSKTTIGSWGVSFPNDVYVGEGTPITIQTKTGKEWTGRTTQLDDRKEFKEDPIQVWFMAKDEEEVPEAEKGNHLYSVGARETWRGLTIAEIAPFYGKWGEGYRVKFTTPNDDVITWFASCWDQPEWARVGNRVTLTATVKAHNEFKGKRETVVNRGKVVVEE